MAEMTKNPNPALKFLKNSLKIVKSHLGHFGQLQLKNNFMGENPSRMKEKLIVWKTSSFSKRISRENFSSGSSAEQLNFKKQRQKRIFFGSLESEEYFLSNQI